MVRIRPIASGSSGNCYMVSDGNTHILIDCGISEKRIKEALWSEGMRLSDISGCLVSHSHGDHVKAAQKLADNGVDIYTSPETMEAAGLKGHRIHSMQRMIGAPIGTLYAYPYDVEHDAPGTFAFSVASKNERVLYITDTMYFKYQISGVTHLMIEANYDPEIMVQNAETGRVNSARVKRTIGNHMSIETALMTIERMDKSRLKEIWLLHLSNDNAGQDFRQRVRESTGCEVYMVE